MSSGFSLVKKDMKFIISSQKLISKIDEILTLEDKLHILASLCNILYVFWQACALEYYTYFEYVTFRLCIYLLISIDTNIRLHYK